MEEVIFWEEIEDKNPKSAMYNKNKPESGWKDIINFHKTKKEKYYEKNYNVHIYKMLPYPPKNYAPNKFRDKPAFPR